MSAPEYRTMRAVDMAKLAKVILPQFVGWVFLLDGKEIGYGCVLWAEDGRAFLTFDWTDDLKCFPVFMHKMAQRIIRAGLTAGPDLYAAESVTEPGAAKWLRRLGFKPTDEILKSGERVMKFAHGE